MANSTAAKTAANKGRRIARAPLCRADHRQAPLSAGTSGRPVAWSGEVMAEVRGPRSEVRGQKSEVGGVDPCLRVGLVFSLLTSDLPVEMVGAKLRRCNPRRCTRAGSAPCGARFSG